MLDHFSLLARCYDRLLGPPDKSRLVELMKLPTPGRLLDLGGGTGRVSQVLREMVDGIVVCDPSRKMLSRSRGKGLAAVAGRAERLPFARASFERILVVDSFHHFTSQAAAVRDMVRVLRPGGVLVVEEPDIARPLVRCAALAEKALLMRSHFFRPEDIRSMLKGGGLETQIFRDHRHTAWIVARSAP